MAFSLQVLAFILLCSAVSISICYGDCPQNDWFGDSSCPYQCHCEDNRNCGARSGVCSDRCKLGWFGPSCQYLSSEFSPAAGEPDVTWLADDNHMTCNVRDDQTIAVALRRPHLLTWVRVRVRDTDGLESLQLGYRTLDQPDKDVTCMDAQMIRVDDMTIDIACRSSVVVGHVTLSGRCVKHLCSLHISAGRNVALRQVNARQSSTFSNWFARNAVDGDIGPVDGSDTQLRRTCTHTDSYYQDAWWSLTFSTAVHLSEVVIYNRRNPSRTGCCEIRLVGFTLKAFKDSAEQNELYSYTDPRTDYLDEYYLLPSPALPEPVKKIKIFKSSNSEILTLCEVVALGENACPPGRFGLECERQCNCANQEATCFVSTGGCPSGCAAGYKGEDCWTECVRGRYGQECKEPCSDHCADPRNYCDAVTGSCLDGCIAGFQPPLCKEVCSSTKFGLDCNQNCSALCLDRDCHHVTGECRSCHPGFIGDFCQRECPKHAYGADCEQNCSLNCLGQLCDHVTGKCDNCTMGRTGEYCETTVTQAQAGMEGGDDGAVIGAAVGVTLALLVVITLIVAFACRSRLRRDETEPFEMKQAVNRACVTSQGSDSPWKPPRPTRTLENFGHGKVRLAADGPDSVYTNVLPNNTAVGVTDLKTFLLSHATDSLLSQQFESIPLANSYPQKVGLTPPNNKKNRYKNIVPYDHSRVLLEVNPHKKQEDYINASYIKGYKNQDTYIAAQAPNDLILQDFVRMIWEKEVDRVVMLTNLVEMRKVKCTQYWPVEGEQTVGNIRIELLSSHMFAEYTIRQIRLHKSGETARDVTQFHFTAWPDKSVPDSPWGLVDFYHRVSATPGSAPLLVHCSAGVGRTGTFIALCQLLQEAEETGKMDFLAVLWRLRQDRVSMIQTVEQYVFLHWAALIGFTTVGTCVKVKDIVSKLQDLDDGGFKREFEAVVSVSRDEEADMALAADDTEDVYQNTRAALNKQKNRISNILPKDAHRPQLTCEIKTMGKYINAVFVPTISRDRQDILTQLPLPSTVTDFWRLVTQYHVGLVVAFETDSKHTDETIGEFLPRSEAEPLPGALFEVQARCEEENQLWKQLRVTVFKKRKSLLGSTAEQHHLTCLLCKDSDPDTQTILEYLKKVKSCQPPEQCRTLYMCRNGAKLCGLMCVQSILVDRLEADQCLTVPLVVGAIKAIRLQVIPTVNQYKCLYNVLKLVQDSSSVYGNVGATRNSTSETSGQCKPGPAGHTATSGTNRSSPTCVEGERRRGSWRSSQRSSPALISPQGVGEPHAEDGGAGTTTGNSDVDAVDNSVSSSRAMQGGDVAVEYANM